MTDELAPHRFPGVTFGQVAAELTREGAARLNVYKAQVDKGAMTSDQARREIALVEALAEDCTRFREAQATVPAVNPLTIARRHAFTWRERRDALLRELAMRARLYPRWIETGKLSQADADKRNRCLEALLALYEDGLDCPPEEWPEAAAEIDARRHPPQQENLAL